MIKIYMKQKLFTFSLALLASVGTIFAYSGTCGENLTWDLTDSVLTISGTGEMYDYDLVTGLSNLPDYCYEGVDPADYNLTDENDPIVASMVSLEFPTTPWFFLRKYIVSLIINDGVTNIGDNTFYYCYNLKSVTMSNSVTSIGDNAFRFCYNLKSVTLSNSVTSIGEGAFCICRSLTSVIIPNSVTNIGMAAFSGCTNLSSVTIGNSVTSIGDAAFLGCGNLTSVTIPNSVTSIGDAAFVLCDKLTYVTIGNSVTSIGDGAFYDCSKLVAIYATCGDLDRLKQLLDNDSRVKYEPIPYSLVIIPTRDGTIVTNYDSLTICDEPNVNCAVIPNYGYHFVQWTDGNTDNPRTIVLTQDTTLSAICAPNQYSISVTCDENYGRIEGENGTFDYLTSHEYSALANTGYHFVKWSDGNTENPRTIVLTQDTTLSAVFAINRYLVQFFGFNNVLLDSQSIEHGTAAVAPEAPTVDHFDFVGWDKEFTNITSDLDVYAIYQKNTEDVENVMIDALPYKVMIDGQVLILRGDHIYTLTGQELE